MKANCWMGTRHVEVSEVPDPTILNPRDAIIRITNTAICGSDLRYKLADAETWTQGVYAGNRVLVKDVTTLALWTL